MGICVDMGVGRLYGMVVVGVCAIVGASVWVWFLEGGCGCVGGLHGMVVVGLEMIVCVSLCGRGCGFW